MNPAATSRRPRRTSYTHLLPTALSLLLLTCAILYLSLHRPPKTHGQERTWHGGHPARDHTGSCWCGNRDGYCMCTPALSVDVVLFSRGEMGLDVWMVRRKDTGQFATVGGFVQVGEIPTDTLLREVEEETGILLPHRLLQPRSSDSPLRFIGAYHDPRRDGRRSNVSLCYALEFDPVRMTTRDGTNVPRGGDDAGEVVRLKLEEVGTRYRGKDFFADHLTILLDFKELMGMNGIGREGLGELSDGVSRSTCQIGKD